MLNWNAFAARLLASLSLTVVSSTAIAQVAAEPPAIRELVDASGVDLLTGTMISVYQGPSIGAAGASVNFTQQVRGGGLWHSLLGAIVGDGGVYSVSLDGTTEKFTVSGGVYTPAEGNGATLTVSGSTWTYTSRSGAVATFFQRTTDYAYPEDAQALLSTITYPNGERATVEYTNETVCLAYIAPNCTIPKTAVRVKSLTSSYGYKISLGYHVDSGVTAIDFFFAPIQVTVSNLATGATVGSVGISYSWTGASSYSMTLTESLGRVTEYVITQGVSIDGIRRPGSAVYNVVVSYDSSGIVWSVSNDGIVTNYAYSEAGGIRTTTVTNAAGGQRVVTSNIATGRVLSDRDELNRTTSFAYDAQGRLSRVTAPEGIFVEYTRDARGNVTQTLLRAKPGSGLADIITTAGFIATCTNPKTCNQPNWTRDAKGNQTDYTYDQVHGGVLTVTLPAPAAGAVRPQARYSYTALEAWYLNSSGVLAASGQPIHLLTGTSTCRTLSSCLGSADESKTVIGYGSAGVANNRWPLTVTSSDGSGALVSTETYAYDAAGNALTADGPLAGTADTTRTRYDALRRVVGMIGPDPDGAGPQLPVATRHTYNTAGDLVSVEKGTVNSHADADWASFVPFESVSFEHDAAGRRIKSSLSAGGSTYALEQVWYDTLGQPTCAATRMNPAAFGSLPHACGVGTQGSFGPDRVTSRTYDAAGQVTKVSAGHWTPDLIHVATATFTPNGRVATVADGRGNLTTYEYDGFDRLIRTRFPNPTTPGASSATDYDQLTYDANSAVVSVRARDGQTISLGRDNLNRLVLKDLPAGPAQDVFFSYDNQHRLLAANFGGPSGAGIVDTHDGLGRVASRASFGRTLSYAYDAAGRRTRVTHADGFYADYAYTAAAELSSVTDSTGTTLATFTYDSLGRRTGIARGNATSTTYGYDAVSRLATLTQNLAGTSYDGASAFTHSPANQIASHSQSNDAVYTWTAASSAIGMSHNGLNQVTQIGSAAISHDMLGNLETGESTFAYGYDVENHLRSALAGSTTVSLAYDPLGLLSEVTINGTSTKFLYDGPDLVAEYGDSGALLRRYVHGAGVDEPLVWYEGAGTTDRRYLHADERGSIVAISNNSGAGTVSFKYSPDGEATNAASSRFGYTGQVWLAQPGLCYYKSRMYSPKLGRFLQTDAIGYAGGMNLYSYVGGDPINRIDPHGFIEEVLVTAPRFYDTMDRDLWFLDLFESYEEDRNRDGEAAERPQGEQEPSTLKKLGQCASDQLGLSDIAALVAIGAGQPIPGTKPFVTPGSSRGTSLAGMAADEIFQDMKFPDRVPTIVGGPGTGRPLAIAGTRSVARFAARAVPVVGWAMLAYDAVSIGVCALSNDEN